MPKAIFDVLINEQTYEGVQQLSAYLFKEEELDGPDFMQNGEPAGGFAQMRPSPRRPDYTQCWAWGSETNLGKLKAGSQEPVVFWVEER